MLSKEQIEEKINEIWKSQSKNQKGAIMKTAAVEKILLEMLREKTGAHMCDSGDHYGRHWERNQKLTLDAIRRTPAVEFDRNDNSYTISVFHFLRNRLEIDELCKTFNRLNKNAKEWDFDGAYGVCKRAGKFLENLFEIDGGWNTYNGDTHLSQTLQGHNLKLNPENVFADYYLIQIHGGCDVRGGYTNARMFKAVEDRLLLEDVYGSITRENGERLEIDNCYDGTNLLYTENHQPIEVNENDKVELWL